jgi:hypothetical protein
VAETFEQAAKRVEAVGDVNAEGLLADVRGGHNDKDGINAEKQHIESV